MFDNNKKQIEGTLFDQLSKRYIVAITGIAIIIIVSQLLIQTHLANQLNDSRLINVAGKQRMLSQKLVKDLLKMSPSFSEEESNLKGQIGSTLESWIEAHNGLIHGSDGLDLPNSSSNKIRKMFDDIDDDHQAIVNATEQILKLDDLERQQGIKKQLEIVNYHEEVFLKGMDDIVLQYELESKKKLEKLKFLEFVLLFIALLALLLELLFIFKPTARFVQDTVDQLTNAKSESDKKAIEISNLFIEKEASVQELKALNFALDKASLFASITLQGDLIYMSDKLTQFLGYTIDKPEGKFVKILSQNEDEQDNLNQIINTPRSSIWNGEVQITTLDKAERWLDISIVPVNRKGVRQDYLVLCNDITERKEASKELNRINREKLIEEIRLQKIRSSQVVEAQEKERERIAKEIHDGIGQMLTALKFNLEALGNDQPEKFQQKIDTLKSLSSDLIKGVRIATFNLTPPELTDYGVGTALSKLCNQLKHLTGQNILFENKSNFEGRLPSIIETNIYRITQEAVNNAIKYANANYILVTYLKTDDILSIKIDDDGEGFVPEDIKSQPIKENSSNMGLEFMKERVEFIFGRIFIRSAPGQGTRITVNIPLNAIERKDS